MSIEREALAELLACCTEPAGWTTAMVLDRVAFDEMLDRSTARMNAAVAAARAALAQPAVPVQHSPTFRRLWDNSPVTEQQVAQPAVPATDRYSELADALGCDCMDSHAARIERARRLAVFT